MTIESKRFLWWSSATIRICHPNLDPAELTKLLDADPSIALRPGESKVPYGECRSAGYWCTEYRVDEPLLPNHVIEWTENFVNKRIEVFKNLQMKKYFIDVYIGIHSNILALGFDVPATPTLWELGIPLGIEYFSP
ncbi:MAG: hypothetical protein R3B84_01495 [Zavarzinella sp.]